MIMEQILQTQLWSASSWVSPQLVRRSTEVRRGLLNDVALFACIVANNCMLVRVHCMYNKKGFHKALQHVH